MPLSRTEARKILLAVKGTLEKPYFGKPAIFHAEQFVGRVHDKEEAVVLRIGTIEMRDVMLEAEPELFYITDHYKPWPMLLARLTALDAGTLRELAAARIKEIAAKPAKRRRAAKDTAPKRPRTLTKR